MVDPTKPDQKDLLKNKRVLKGTPLHRLATRYAAYGALSLGCLHVSIMYLVSQADIDEWWYTAGPEQIAEKAGKAGLFYKHDQDRRTLEDWADMWKTSPAYTFIQYLSETYNEFKETYFSRTPVDSVTQPSETTRDTNTSSTSPAASKAS